MELIKWSSNSQHKLVMMSDQNDTIKLRFHSGHLEFQDGRPRYKFGISSIECIDILNMGLDTNMMFLQPLGADIFINIVFVTPISEILPHQRAP